MATQIERLDVYLRYNKSITPLEAWQQLGIYRLSAAIYDLRKMGWKIETDTVKVVNQFGENCHVAKYVLQ